MDFFGDNGPLRTIPRDVVDGIIENLNVKDLKNLTLVNRFFNDAVENIDEEANPNRSMQLYKPKSQGGHYYKSLDLQNIENIKNEYREEYEYEKIKLPKNFYYFEIMESDESGFIQGVQYIIDPSTFEYNLNDKNDEKYFSIKANYKKFLNFDYYYPNILNFKIIRCSLINCIEDEKSLKTKIEKLNYILKNKKDTDYTFTLKFNESLKKYSVKKVSFL